MAFGSWAHQWTYHSPIFGSFISNFIVGHTFLLRQYLICLLLQKLSTLWYLTNFHTLMSSSMHLTTCHRDPSTISSSWHFAWYDGEKCLPGNHCNHHLVVVSQGFYASKNLGQFSYSRIWIRFLSAHIKKNSKSLRVAQFLFVGKVPRMGAYLNYRAFPKW